MGQEDVESDRQESDQVTRTEKAWPPVILTEEAKVPDELVTYSPGVVVGWIVAGFICPWLLSFPIGILSAGFHAPFDPGYLSDAYPTPVALAYFAGFIILFVACGVAIRAKFKLRGAVRIGFSVSFVLSLTLLMLSFAP